MRGYPDDIQRGGDFAVGLNTKYFNEGWKLLRWGIGVILLIPRRAGICFVAYVWLNQVHAERPACVITGGALADVGHEVAVRLTPGGGLQYAVEGIASGGRSLGNNLQAGGKQIEMMAN